MSTPLTLENKNNLSLGMENRTNSPTLDETDKTIDEMEETFDSQGTPIFYEEAKNTLTLTLETKV